MGVGILLLASPLGKLIQTVLNGNLAAAALVPGSCLLLRCWAFGFGDEHIGQAKRDVESALEQFGGLVHSIYDVCLGPVLVSVERIDIGTVSGDTHQRDLAGTGASGSAANGGGKVNTGAVASGLGVVVAALALEHG